MARSLTSGAVVQYQFGGNRARLVRQCLPPAFDEMLTVADDAEKLILHYFRRGFERASGGAA
jgi:hypothetical protein